jgi:hypothetical protein
MHDLRDCLLALITISGAGAAEALAAGSSLPYGEGGYVPNFVKIVRQYNMSGDEFRIEGVCKSACTMFLGIRDVCGGARCATDVSRRPRYCGKSNRTRYACEPRRTLSKQ